MRHRRPGPTEALVGLLVAVLGAGCPRPTSKSPGLDQQESPRGAEPRVRVGRILRLARAGVIEETRHPSGQVAVLALVPVARASRSWQRALDTQGNQFRVAPGGRIAPDGEPSPDREPASVDNVAFYYAQTLALLEARHRREGLVMAAEILDLPARDPVVRMAQRHLCALFARLAIQGKVRERLYQNLVAVSHREGVEVVVREHAHGFSLRTPLGWKLLAGGVPDLGPRATALVVALPAVPGQADDARANVLWTTAPAKGDLATWAAVRRLTTPDSKILPVTMTGPPGVSFTQAFRVEPLAYRGRRLSSLQVFFQERGLGHHVALLAPDGPSVDAARPLLDSLVRSFVPGSRPACSSSEATP